MPLARRLLAAALWQACLGPGRGPAIVGALASAVLGVEPSAQASYAGQTFRCLDGSGAPLPASAVNDEACDCADGSDEPGTGACAGQDRTLFFCANEGSMPRRLYASRVGDGVCDCCDGSDEASLAKRRPAAKCANSCAEEGAKKAEERKEKVEMLRRALKRQDEIRQEGLGSRDKLLAEMETLNAELPELEKALEAATAAANVEREAKAAQEAAEKNASLAASAVNPECRWRQTGACSGDGSNREPANDKPCTEAIAKGLSGFCDCDGNGLLDPEETGYSCEIPAGESAEETRKCSEVCPKLEDSSAPAEEAPQAEEEAAADEEKPQVSEYAKWMEGAGETAATEAPAADAEAAAGEAAEAAEEAPKDEGTKEETAVERETAAQGKVTDHKEKIQDTQDQLNSLSADKLGYATLLGQTLAKQVSEFRYEIEFFSRASQDSTSLGTWSKWTGPRSAVFEEGTMCWGGPARKLNVNFVCGEQEDILDVFEPSRCVYEATVEHPGACAHAELQELEQGSQVVGPKDEL